MAFDHLSSSRFRVKEPNLISNENHDGGRGFSFE